MSEDIESTLTATNNFVIKPSQVSDIHKELEERKQKMLHRINKLVDRTMVKDVPVLSNILAVTIDPDQLKLLAKVLDRVADIIPEFTKIDKRLSMLDLLEQDKEWFTSNFGDLNSEVDQLVSDIFKDTNNDS